MAPQSGPQRGSQGHQRKETSIPAPPVWKRIIAFGIVALAVLAAAAYFLWPVVKPSGPVTPGAVTVQLSMGGFNPSRIEAREGKPLILHLVNKDNRFHTDGGGWHQFAIDELGVDVRVPPLKAQEFTFTPTESGTFEFYCDVCCGGRQNPYMVGALIVKG